MVKYRDFGVSGGEFRMDNIDLGRLLQWNIEIRRLEYLVRRIKGNSSLLLKGNSSLLLKGNSSLLLKGNSSLLLKGNSSLLLKGNSSLFLKGNSSLLPPHSKIRIFEKIISSDPIAK